MGRIFAALAIALTLVVGVRSADAGPAGFKRVTVDHVEVMPSVLHGMARMRIIVDAVDLETDGTPLPVAGDTKQKQAWSITGSSAIKRVPYFAGLYGGADVETAIAIVVETTGAYGNDLDAIKTALHDDLLVPLEKLDGTQVAIIGYNADVTAGKLVPVKTAETQLESLGSDATNDDAPALTDAVDRAVKLLKKARPASGASPSSLRRLVIVVSDGRTADDDRDAVTKLGADADRAAVRIHAIAYAPDDIRAPLLGLGELAKVSNGSLRYVRVFPALQYSDADKTRKQDPDSFAKPIKKLSDEILGSYVLTLFVPLDDVPRKVSVAATIAGRVIRSPSVKVPELSCGDDECPGDGYCSGTRCVVRGHEEGRGFFGWLLIIVGIVVGLLAVLLGLGFAITKLRARQPKVAPPPAPPAGVGVATSGLTGAMPAAPPAPAPAPLGPGPKLYILSGPQTGERVQLRHGFTIGKAPGCDLSLAHDGFASGSHAHIVMDTAGNCQIIDQGSTNGTYINGVRITESRLYDGMAIRCGSTELRFLAQ